MTNARNFITNFQIFDKDINQTCFHTASEANGNGFSLNIFKTRIICTFKSSRIQKALQVKYIKDFKEHHINLIGH